MNCETARRSDYWTLLNKVLDELFAEASKDGFDWGDMAEAAGVAYTTVARLGRRDTTFPAFRTIILLARATGFNLDRAMGKGTVRRIMHMKPKPFDGAPPPPEAEANGTHAANGHAATATKTKRKAAAFRVHHGEVA